MEEDIMTLIPAIAIIIGAIIGIFGQLIGNWITHKNKISYLKHEIYFKRKLKYAEDCLTILDGRTKKYIEIFNILKDIPYKNRKNIDSLLQSKQKINEKKIWKNESTLYFEDWTFAKDILEYLDLEKKFKNGMEHFKNCKTEEEFKDKMSLLREIVEQKMTTQNSKIANSFKKSIKMKF